MKNFIDRFLFLGNSYYAFNIDPEVKSFIAGLSKDKIGKIVNFGSAALLNSTFKKVKAEAAEFAKQFKKV